MPYQPCWEGVLYLAFIIDVFSRMTTVGWQLACHMRKDLVLDALRMAIGIRGPGADVKLVHRSDQGPQHTSYDRPSAPRRVANRTSAERVQGDREPAPAAVHRR